MSDYVSQTKSEIIEHNSNLDIVSDIKVNGRNLTNIGLFRKYTENYLVSNKLINNEMTVMCRQLTPTAQGIPLEIYAFSKDKIWVNYEHISSDIFDHLLAAIPYFHLECFELSPTLPKI